jgi:Alanine dehydrogenase/PNT, N-terminal domain
LYGIGEYYGQRQSPWVAVADVVSRVVSGFRGFSNIKGWNARGCAYGKLEVSEMHVGVPVETRANEARVAATPETVKKLVSQGHRVTVQYFTERRDLCPHGLRL